MSLITHVWGENINLVAADRRVREKGAISADGLLRIHRKFNMFAAHYGDSLLGDKLFVQDVLQEFTKDYEGKNTKVFPKRLKAHFAKLKSDLDAGFYVGGFYKGETHSYNVNIKRGTIIDMSKLKVCYSYNTINNEQSARVKEILTESFLENCAKSIDDENALEDVSDEQFVAFINQLYAKTESDPVANPGEISGAAADIGIIREEKFYWLQQIEE